MPTWPSLLVSRVRRGASLFLVAILVGAAACDDASENPAEPVSQAVGTAAASEPATPAVVVAASPMAGLDAPGDAPPMVGVVVERLSAGRYTYLRLGTDARWIATTGEGAHLGDRVSVRSLGSRRDFTSSRLGRTFDELVFGVVRPADELARETKDRT